MNEDPFSTYQKENKSLSFPALQEMDYVGLLNNKQFSDVTFIVEGNKFYAHKDILCSRSKYFEKLLRGTFTQYTGMELEIEIRDSPISFFKVLQFIYTGTVGDLKTLDEYVLFGLLNACVLYEMDSLQQILENHIGDNRLTVSNICTIWRLALETGSPILAQKCEEYFRKYSSKITQLPDFTEQMWEPINLDSFIPEGSDFVVDSDFLVQSFLSEADESTDPPEKKQRLEYEPLQPLELVPQQNQVLQQQQKSLIQIPQYQMYTNTVQLKQEQPQVRPNNVLSTQIETKGQASVPFNSPIIAPKAESLASYVLSNKGAQNVPPHASSNWINIYPQQMEKQLPFSQPIANISQLTSLSTESNGTKPPPPSYKLLAAKQKRLPMLQGPIWSKALEKMNTLIDLSRELIGADIGTLFLHDPITNELYSHVAHPEPVDIAIPAHLGIAGACFTTNKCINSPSAYTDTRFYSGIDRQMGAPTLAILAVPVPSENGKILGVIELLNKKKTTEFSEENEREIKTTARMVGRIVEKATLEVKNAIEKKGLKRIHMFNNLDESRVVKRPRARRRDSIPVFHFKQMSPPVEKLKKGGK